jgi:hypothetical protein
MESPDVYICSFLRWQFFLSLTFGRDYLASTRGKRLRINMWFALYRTAASWFKTPRSQIRWALRQEHGEVGGRAHFHALVCGFPEDAVREATCMALRAQWKRLGGGHSVVRCFEAGGGALAYSLWMGNENAGANQYEIGKYSSADWVMLSDSIWIRGDKESPKPEVVRP